MHQLRRRKAIFLEESDAKKREEIEDLLFLPHVCIANPEKNVS